MDGLVGWGGRGGITSRLDFNVDAGAEDLVPFVDGEDQYARVERDPAGEGDADVREGGDPAEGVDEGRGGGEVAGYGVVLFRRGALGEGVEDVADVFDCRRLWGAG